MHCFFVEPSQIDGHVIHITGNDVNHITNVLRMKPEEELIVNDGCGKEYHCYLESSNEREVCAHIVYVQETDHELSSHIYLFQGLPKQDKMELIIQKAVELGVWEIIPVQTSRCVVRLDEQRREKKQNRWQKIAQSAAKQSGRGQIPNVHAVCSFSEALAYAKDCQVKLIPYELTHNMEETRRLIGEIDGEDSIAVFIGPEGGFTEEEMEQAMAAGWQPITLGRRILRTETAGLAVLSVLMMHLERD